MTQTEANRSEAPTVGSLLRRVHTLKNDLRGRLRRHGLLGVRRFEFKQ